MPRSSHETQPGKKLLATACLLVFSGSPFPLAAGSHSDVDCGGPATLVSAIKGSGTLPGLPSGTVAVIEGIVTGDFQGKDRLNGFFLQEEVADWDGQARTSEGIFVLEASPSVDLREGDLVRVRGEVGELDRRTLFRSTGMPVICGQNLSVEPVPLPLPFDSRDQLEQVEGMLVTLAGPAVVTDNYNLARYGELTLSAGERLFQPTQIALPGVAAAAANSANDNNRILLDDGTLRENPELPPYLDAIGTRRVGDTVVELIGILGHGRSSKRQSAPIAFRLYPAGGTGSVRFAATNPRPEPPPVGGAIKVASLNVLNYFTTLDRNGNKCGPDRDLDCRGAESRSEFDRQTSKIISAIRAMDADIIGLVEIENNGDDAVGTLVERINSTPGGNSYDAVGTGPLGKGAIRVAVIFRPDTVTTIGYPEVLDQDDDRRFLSEKNRPVLAQTFETVSGTNPERFTVVINHFKSKGSPCDDVGDPARNDGQGNCSLVRTEAAEALIDWLARDPTASGDPDFLVIGDLNAYSREDVLERFRDAGFVDLIHRYSGKSGSYRLSNYVFRGESGALDHALASRTLAGRITGAGIWSSNADEPRFLDYNENYKSPRLISLLQEDAFRSSDHDPVIVGLIPVDD